MDYKWKKVGALFLLMILPLSSLHSIASRAGAVFLIIYPGARPNGMGAAFTALADDAIATYYNDGGLGFQEEKNVSLMHVNWLPGLYPGMYYEFLSYVTPLKGGGVFGGHIIYLSTGYTEGIDEKGQVIDTWTTWDASIKVCYSIKLNPKLAVGIGSKYIYSFLAPTRVVRIILKEEGGGGTGTSWAFDGGLLYKMTNRFQIGMALQNIGPHIKYTQKGEADPLPWTLRIGIGIHLITEKNNKLTVLGELTKIVVGILEEFKEIQTDIKKGITYFYQDTWKGIGVEWVLGEMFTGRAGYFWDVIGSRVGFTYGGGINLRGLQLDIGVDAALYDFPTSNYRFSLSYFF
jgi:hypothetical protein